MPATVIGFFLLGLLAPLAMAAPTCHRFDHYPVAEQYPGPYAQPDGSGSATARRFRTAIRSSYEPEPDFAGPYRVVSWGCGSNCHQFALVDTRTGEVFDAPGPAALDAGYRADSALFVVDPAEVIEESGGGDYRTQYFMWDETRREFQRLEGCGAAG